MHALFQIGAGTDFSDATDGFMYDCSYGKNAVQLRLLFWNRFGVDLLFVC